MTHVLVPVAVLEGETVPPGLIELLGSVTVTVLGYHEVPEQTPPDQARLQFEDRATEILDDICETFAAAGATAYHRLVFTRDRTQSIDRVAAEIDADAIVVVQPTPQVEDVYVAVDTNEEISLVASVVGDIVGDVGTDVYLRYFLGDDERSVAEEALADLSRELVEAGVAGGRIDTAIRDDKKAVGSIVADTEGKSVDLVALSDPGLSIGEVIFGDLEERIANRLLAPVLVIRRPEKPAKS